MTIIGTRSTRHRAKAQRRHDMLAGFGALATLTALVIGVPVALVATSGWPWPNHWPSGEQIGQHLLQPDDGHLLVATLMTIAWIAWLLFTTAAVVEALGQVRGTLPRRLPVVSLAQHLAAPLVATVALLAHTPTASTVALAATTSVVDSVAPSPAAGIPTQPKAPVEAASRPPSQAGGQGLRLYVVEPPRDGTRDTLWSIAAKHLGDPLRWHEIADLNRGRAQPDGGRLTDPHWIQPGWRLLMPADASGLPAAEPFPPSSPHQVTPRRHSKGQRPPVENRVPDVPAIPDAPPKGGDASTSAPAVSAVPHTDDNEPVVPIGLAVMGVLAAGLLTALGRRRVLQRRHRRTGERIPHPPAAARAAEIRLRAAADPPKAEAVVETLRALAQVDPAASAHVQAAELTEHGLELLLDLPLEAPAPFRAFDDGTRWRLSAPPTASQDDQSALPALASIGHRDGNLVFVDLERVQVLSLAGDAAAADRLLAWITADLAAGAWATTANITMIGIAPQLTAIDSERIRNVDALTDEVVTALEAHVARFTGTRHQDAIESRQGDPFEPWPVEVVLVGSPAATTADAQLLRRLVNCMPTGRRVGAAVVLAADVPQPRARAVIDGGLIHIPGVGVDAQVAQIHPAQVADIASLVESADELVSEQIGDETAVPYPDAPSPTAPVTPVEVVSATADRGDDDLDAKVETYLSGEPSTLRVQLLGPVTVSAPGPLEPKRLPTSTELVAFLACRPYGATLQDVDDALWPERAVPRSTRNTVITRARTWVGTTDNDEPRLSRVDSSGRLRLTDALVDWHLFEQLVARARHRNELQKIDDLRRALSLIHGKPFEGIQPGRYAWLAGDNLEEHMTAAVIDAAHALAEELLAIGEPGAARDVARTAQLVDRHDERPWRDLLRAEAALGRRRKVREHVRDLMQVLDVEVADQLMPETAQLIKHLLESERKVAAG